MNVKRWVLFLCIALGAVFCAPVFAGPWPQFESRLATWDGAKEVQLPAGVDPLADSVFTPVVEMLLNRGFVVHTAAQKGAADGLILTQHQGASGPRLVLTRARDGALLALEPLAIASSSRADVRKNNVTANVLSTASVSPFTSRAPATSVEPLRLESTPQERSMKVGSDPTLAPSAAVLVEMPGTPRSIATWVASGAAPRDFNLFVLYDTRLVNFRYHFGSLEQVAEFIPPARVSRALRLECTDLDGDGTPELAPVWVEDIYSVDEGTESRLHSWVVGVDPDGMMRARSADLEGYLALTGEGLYLQERGEYRTFAASVYAVEFANGTFRRSTTPVTQTQHWIFNHARWPDNERVLIWNDDQRLVLAARAGASGGQSAYPTGTLLSDFGSYVGTSIYIPLKEPEYRSGFSPHDKVMAHKVHVPRRMLPYGDTLFTLARGREVGIPLVGKPSGRDRLVQINAGQSGLQAHFPFKPVDAFILDFGLLEQPGGGLGAILLLNEKQDGGGKAYLQVQLTD
ncbi:MAG: hypothetical protein RBR02_08610 [Desulfuromonadaceae bacterium]|nr:hypothetical protein [Desulfuromonadaceae bacterium]